MGMSENGNGFDFDPQTEEGTQPFALVPKGKYTAEVVDAAIVDAQLGSLRPSFPGGEAHESP